MSKLDQIQCPHCHQEFALSKALSIDIEAQVEQRFLAKLKEQESIYQKQIENFARVNAENKRQLEERLQSERLKIEKETLARVTLQSSMETQDLKNALEEEKKRASEAQVRELELRKREREMQAKAKEAELELERKLDEKLKETSLQVEARIQEQADKKIAELKYKNEQMQKSLEEATRKASQGSQQTQGEMLEQNFEELLREMFENDEVSPVAKGKNGSDIILSVRSRSGSLAGKVSIEGKDTLHFSEKWIGKLKDDIRAEGSDLGVIITKAKPEGMNSDIAIRDGIWIVTPKIALGLIGALREQILRVHQVRMAVAIPADQKEEIFQLLTSTKFKQIMENEAGLIADMLDELAKEQSVANKYFKSRETRLNKLLASKGALYGELQGILGRSLPVIDRFELSAPIGEIQKS